MLRKNHLDLARTPDAPVDGSQCGYQFVAIPWAIRHQCLASQRGQVCGVPPRARCRRRARPSGEHARRDDDADDEPMSEFGADLLHEGEYVSITEHDGIVRPLRAVSVK